MSDEDFPAAHSMDTEWYAVDADGNVGHFRTGEAGAAPNSAMEDYDDDRSVADVIRAIAAQGGVEYEVDDLVAMPGGPVFDYAWQANRYQTASFSDSAACYCILMQLASASVLNGLQQSAPGIIGRLLGRRAEPVTLNRIGNAKYILGYTDGPLPIGTLQQWIQDGSVLKAWVNHPLSSARIGIFEYEHGDVFENWIAGLYLREGVPIRPLKLEQLPEAVQHMFESTRFAKRSFARDAAIDPREAGECSSWGDYWVGMDGVVHGADPEDLDEEELT